MPAASGPECDWFLKALAVIEAVEDVSSPIGGGSTWWLCCLVNLSQLYDFRSPKLGEICGIDPEVPREE